MTEKRALDTLDLFNLKFLQSARFSPDGRQIVFCVSHVNTEAEKERATISILDLETQEQRALTTGRFMDISPTFAPDAKDIAFMSDRTGKFQVYLLPLNGGEPRQVTDLRQGALTGPVWSPDGSQIAFTAAQPFKDDQPPDLSKQVYRVDRAIYRFDALGYLDQVAKTVQILDIGTGEVRQLVIFDMDGGREQFAHPDHGISEAAWTPDGKRIVYIPRPMFGVPLGTKSDLWVLNPASGAHENRSAGLAEGVGGTLSYRAPTTVLSANRLLFDETAEHVIVKVQIRGAVELYTIQLQGEPAWSQLTGGDRALAALDRNGTALLFAEGAMDAPPELTIMNLESGKETRLTDLNSPFFDGIQRPEVEHLLFPGQDGVEVEGWFMKPPNSPGPLPTILYIHGGPHAAYGQAYVYDFHMLVGQGYGVLFINHRASTGYGDDFATAIQGGWGELDYGDLMAGVDEAVSRGLADPDRLGCCGTSGGGNLLCWIVGHTDRFKAAVPQNSVTNFVSFYGTSDIGIWFGAAQMGGHPHEVPETYARCSPITYAHNCTTPTLLVQSEHDWRCPAEQSEQFYSVLKANGCTVEMLRQPGGSHGASINGAINLRREHLLAMVEWFGRYV
jgi:dipeptidyl aminopeptidase/acylaminoacyl peptidase